ncbi:MAG TPA: helix-turn-helix transcriptional regulator [Vicinamibacterales bacterium]
MARVPHPLLRSLGATIRTLRIERGLSQETLADLANLDRSYMSSIERGLRNISVLNMARIASALQVPLGDLVYGKQTLPFQDHVPMDPEDAVGNEWEPGGYLSLG